MHFRKISSVQLALLALVGSSVVAGLTQKYCSNENTASGDPEQSIYQSNGNCQTQCQNYAFAVVQGQSCWCSNYIPNRQESVSSCNEACPGYPFENCGSSSAGLFGYVALGKSPSGTAGSGSSQTVSITSTQDPPTPAPSFPSSSSSSPSSIDASTGQTAGTSVSSTQLDLDSNSFRDGCTDTPLRLWSKFNSFVQSRSVVSSSAPASIADETTVVASQTVVSAVTVATTVTADASDYETVFVFSTSDSSASSTLSTSIISKSWTPTPVITTIISSGSVITVTTTPTVNPEQFSRTGSGISKGAVAGVVIAAFVGLAIVGFGLFFCLRRRSREEDVIDSTGTMVPSRVSSQMSRNGLLGNPFRNPSVSQTYRGSSTGDVSPVSPAAEKKYRQSVVFDQRLNPDLMIHETGSRVSITTLEDHRDYNRRLNIMNPDPEDRD